MANKERVALGVTALKSRSEDGSPVYPKGRMKLHRINSEGKSSWCCLGVLSKVAIENGCLATSEIGPLGEWETEHSSGDQQEIFGCSSEFLPPEIQEWYGFDSLNPRIKTPEGNLVQATTWNDFGKDREQSGASLLPVIEEDFDAIADGFARTYLEEE